MVPMRVRKPVEAHPEPRFARELPAILPLPFRRGEGRGEGSVFAWKSRGAKRVKWSGSSLPLNLGSPETCRRLPLSPSEGERAGVRGPSLPGGSGAQSASNGRGVLLSSGPGRGGPFLHRPKANCIWSHNCLTTACLTTGSLPPILARYTPATMTPGIYKGGGVGEGGGV